MVDLESLILMKRTQRAKDYAIIGELANRLPPEREIELTTDPDRILKLAPQYGHASSRPAARAASSGTGRRAVVHALADETDELQANDRRRLGRYEAAARDYLEACGRAAIARMPLREAHRSVCELASALLPGQPLPEEADRADAQ